MNALSFSFENTAVRTLGTPENPLFVALDVCNALQHSNPWKAIKDLCDAEDVSKQELVDVKGRKQTVNCVNESGLYALIFGSKLESAKRFKRWVTSEVLPAIRKQGRYECPLATITPAQQHQLREAVAKRAKVVSAHYQTIYRSLYARYQVPRYTEILAKDFDDAIEFVRTVDIRVPESRQPTDPEELPGKSTERPLYVSSLVMERLQTFVYYYRYLFREEIDRLINIMRLMGSPHAEMLWDSLHDIHLGLLEDSLAKQGYAVKDLDSYRYWSKRAKACQLA